MAQLLVRNIASSLVKKLKLRAIEHGVSAEEEHRLILAKALGEPASPLRLVDHLLSSDGRVDIELPSRSVEYFSSPFKAE